ncbi:MAG: hypothetical protein ACP5LO_06335 [Calditerrivibrio sp.]|uniref:hypothetical protein n=1 Tax=Calditerrivibrio sp. TaxID=2792612 RepID=UPI003D147534
MDKFYAGSIFEIEDKRYETKKLVVLVRSIITKEHFYLISFSSFEPWSEKVVTIDNKFERAWITLDEVKYLAETDYIRYVGDVNSYKEGIASVIKENKPKVA